MAHMNFEQTMMLDASADMRETKDGYLVCSPRIARTGIQLYRGPEVGRPDLDVVRVYRPESEVMHKDAVASLAFKPVTIEHPNEPITAKNWKHLAVGHLSDEALRDGEFIRTPMILMDAAAIAEVRGGRQQLSVGYTAVLKWIDGETDEGEPYDAIQTAIRANHVAITHAARGGPKLRMGDNSKEIKMAKYMVDGVAVELEDRDLQVVERYINKLQGELATAQTVLATARTTAQNDVATAQTETANATAQLQTKDAELATLKQQLTDATVTAEKLDLLADARAAVKQRAKALLDSVVLDKKSDADIRRQVVNARMGDTAKDWNDDMITASFNTLAIAQDSGNGSNGLPHVVNVVRHNDNFGGIDLRAKAYAEYDEALANRWKTAGGRSPS